MFIQTLNSKRTNEMGHKQNCFDSFLRGDKMLQKLFDGL